MRRLILLTAATALLGLATASNAAAASTKCNSADLRYAFTKGGPKDFGVFRLKITNGSCKTAHRVAKIWQRRFEANLRAGHVRLPRTVRQFRFTTLRPNAAQTYREKGVRGATTIRFDYVVPNG
jgi:hypothetical protein